MIWTRIVAVRMGGLNRLETYSEVELTFDSFAGWCMSAAWAALRSSLIMEQKYDNDLRCQSLCLPSHSPHRRNRSRGSGVKQCNLTPPGPS